MNHNNDAIKQRKSNAYESPEKDIKFTHGGEIVIEADEDSSIFGPDRNIAQMKKNNRFSLAKIDLSKFNPVNADKESKLFI